MPISSARGPRAAVTCIFPAPVITHGWTRAIIRRSPIIQTRPNTSLTRKQSTEGHCRDEANKFVARLSWAPDGYTSPEHDEPVLRRSVAHDRDKKGTQLCIALFVFCTAKLTLNSELWDQYVGPVSTAPVTSTVDPTPVPSESLTPPPPLYYPPPPFPGGAQVPLQARNESWKFPQSFLRGVSGSAFQIEGAVKAEGRGPSIWDVLTRIPGFVDNNDTADIANNNYFLYKQGKVLRSICC